MNRLRKRAVADERGAMSYEGIRIPEELDRAVQRAVGITSRRHGTLGELVKDVAAQRGARRPENLISEQPSRHEVGVDGEILYTYCFLDALLLPFVMQGERFEVRSESPITVGLSLEDAFALGRDWVSGGPEAPEGMACGC
jgi:hypothetical protein